MLNSRDDNEDHMDLPTFPEDTEDGKADVPAMPDSQTEFLQGKTYEKLSIKYSRLLSRVIERRGCETVM